MAKVTNTPPVVEDFGIELDGKPISIIDARGTHVRLISRAMDGDVDKYYSALMHVVLRVEGKQLAPQEWEELELSLYIKVMGKLTALGFTPS